MGFPKNILMKEHLNFFYLSWVYVEIYEEYQLFFCFLNDKQQLLSRGMCMDAGLL